MVDIIKDFSMNGLAGKGDDQIDLRELISEATDETDAAAETQPDASTATNITDSTQSLTQES